MLIIIKALDHFGFKRQAKHFLAANAIVLHWLKHLGLNSVPHAVVINPHPGKFTA